MSKVRGQADLTCRARPKCLSVTSDEPSRPIETWDLPCKHFTAPRLDDEKTVGMLRLSFDSHGSTLLHGVGKALGPVVDIRDSDEVLTVDMCG